MNGCAPGLALIERFRATRNGLLRQLTPGYTLCKTSNERFENKKRRHLLFSFNTQGEKNEKKTHPFLKNGPSCLLHVTDSFMSTLWRRLNVFSRDDLTGKNVFKELVYWLIRLRKSVHFSQVFMKEFLVVISLMYW